MISMPRVLARRREYSRYRSETLGATLTEENRCSLLDILGSVHEAESDCALVVEPQVITVDFNNLGRLSNDTAVNDSLIVGSDSRRVMQDHNLSFKFPDGRRLEFAIDEDHTLAEVVSFELLLLDLSLDSEADRLSSKGLFNVNSFVMDAFDLNRIELTLLVWTKKQRLVRYDGTGK